MEATESTQKDMNVFSRIAGIFGSPRETFESIDQKPTWLVPFIIGVVVIVIMQLLTLDIQLNDRLAIMRTQDIPADRMEMARQQMQGPMKYIGVVIGPLAFLVILAIEGVLLLMLGNMMLGGDTNFKKIFSIVAWSSLVGILGMIIGTLLIMAKGTTHGVAIDLSVLLPTPEVGADKSVLYRLLAKFDPFVIWELVLWSIGLSVSYKTTAKKASGPVLILWGVWIVISIVLGGIFGSQFGM